MDVKSDVHLLMQVAIKEIKAAYKSGNGLLYGQLGEKYGPIAHKVYTAYQDQCFSPGVGFYDDKFKPVMLDPWTVLGRAKDLMSEGVEVKPSDPEFWNHADLIKSLVEYLELAHCNEKRGCHAST